MPPVPGATVSVSAGARTRSGQSSGRRRVALIGLGLAVLGALVGIASLGDLRLRLPAFIALFAVAWILYACAAWLVLSGGPDGPGELTVILGVALAARAISLATPATLSDDLYRYAWEGGVILHGLSPYALAPSAPALAPLRDAVWAHVNNPDVPSPYPPLAQLGSVAAALFSPHDVWGCKVIAALFDLCAGGLLFLLLGRFGLPASRAIVYAWNPLVLIELPLSGHNDGMMVALLLLALLVGERSALGGAATFGLAGLAKVTPMLALPLLAKAWGRWAIVLAGIVFAAGYSVVVFGGAIGSLPLYLTSFADNDSLHALAREAVVLAGVPGAARVAKGVTLAALAAVIAAMLRLPAARERPLWWQVYAALAASLALASTVHAWYVIWLVPFLALNLQARRTAPYFEPLPSCGWLLFSGLVALPYLTYGDHTWQLWISFVEYVPLCVLLVAPLAFNARRALEQRLVGGRTIAGAKA